MQRAEFNVLCNIVKKRRGPKTRNEIIELAFQMQETGKGPRAAKRFLDRILKTRDMLSESNGDIIELANMHADINGAVTDEVFDAAIESVTNNTPATKTALEHGCYSASVYNFIKCIKSAKADYDAWSEVK